MWMALEFCWPKSKEWKVVMGSDGARGGATLWNVTAPLVPPPSTTPLHPQCSESLHLEAIPHARSGGGNTRWQPQCLSTNGATICCPTKLNVHSQRWQNMHSTSGQPNITALRRRYKKVCFATLTNISTAPCFMQKSRQHDDWRYPSFPIANVCDEDNRRTTLNTPRARAWASRLVPNRRGQGWACASYTLSAAENSTNTWSTPCFQLGHRAVFWAGGTLSVPRKKIRKPGKNVDVSVPDAPSMLLVRMKPVTQCNDWTEASKQSTKAAPHKAHCITRSQQQPMNQMNLEA